MVEMQGIPSASQVVATGLVVSGVEATSIRLISSSTISSFATSAARFGFDWLSLTTTSIVRGPALGRRQEASMMNLSASREGGERPGLRADIAELDRPLLRDRRRGKPGCRGERSRWRPSSSGTRVW